jgi:hypothetical protein
MNEPRGLGVSPDTIRRWQDRGLIALRNQRVQPVRPNGVTSKSSGKRELGGFPPVVEVWLPATRVGPAEDRSVD